MKIKKVFSSSIITCISIQTIDLGIKATMKPSKDYITIFYLNKLFSIERIFDMICNDEKLMKDYQLE